MVFHIVVAESLGSAGSSRRRFPLVWTVVAERPPLGGSPGIPKLADFPEERMSLRGRLGKDTEINQKKKQGF